MANPTRTEIKDFTIKAYRTINDGDKKFQNWRTASTVTLSLVVEIDGIEINLAAETLSHSAWERQMRAWEARQQETAPAPEPAA